jgi:exonuclease SbcD
VKLLHTADWHLNDRLGRVDRTDDLRRAVEKVAAHCHAERVDVLVVAGDLFSELARPDALRETIRHWQDVFADFLTGGGTILTCTGNHDNETFCQTLRHAMTLAAPAVGKPGAVVPPGRLYLASEPTALRLPDRTGTFTVPFVLMPYPTPTRYLGGQRYASADEKHRLLITAFERTLDDLTGPTAGAVLVAHVHVHGSQVGPSLFRMSDQEDVVVGAAAWAERFSYVALGHIHKPQALGGAEHVRYCGSIERLDLGEANNSLGAVLVELGPGGRLTEPVILPLGGTPVYEVAVADPDEDIPRLRAEFADAQTDLVNLHVRYTAGKHNLEQVLKELEAIFPRWYARDWQETGQLTGTLVAGEADRTKGFAETVRDYLRAELQNHPDVDQAELMSLADELIGEA